MLPVGTLKLLNALGVHEIIYGIKSGWVFWSLFKQVLKFVTIKTEQSKE